MARNPKSAPTDVLSAREIRTYTFRAGLVRTEGGLMELVSEGYTYVLGALVLVVMSGALVVRLRESLGLAAEPGWAASAVSAGFEHLAPEQAAATLLLTLAAALLGVELSLGPIAMTVPQTSWWLPLPVHRRGFIQPGFIRSVLWPALAGAAVALVLALGLEGTTDPGRLGLASLCAAALAVLVHALASWAQITGGGAWLRPVAGAVTVLAPLSLVATALYNAAGGSADLGWMVALPTGWPLLVASGSLWPLVVLAAAGMALAWVHARLEQISTARLRASALAASYVAGSVLSMDASELARSLGPASLSGAGPRIRIRLVHPRGTAMARAVKTLLSAQLAMQLRQPARLLRALVLATLPASLASVQFLGNAVLVAVVVYFCAHAAVVSLGATARFAASNPSVDALMPLPERIVRRVHWVVPATGMVLWCGTAFVLLTMLGVGSPALVVLAVLAGPGLGAATIRAAFRPAPDWTMPAVSTAMGPVPTGAVRSFLVGPDLTLITLLPVLICLVSGGVPSVAYPAQLLLSLLAFLWGTRLRRRAQPAGR
ncbi:DUF6297 family protein [Pseudarthrobacter sp. P1]|uniref:DUF6297 family protein n=1 Tax=Pseudarthrobacter sp. P1 TaxID=3418418 RepID=UPI003CE9B81B